MCVNMNDVQVVKTISKIRIESKSQHSDRDISEPGVVKTISKIRIESKSQLN